MPAFSLDCGRERSEKSMVAEVEVALVLVLAVVELESVVALELAALEGLVAPGLVDQP